MTASSSNPAALQGWVKSKDPKTGRVFYANHITRKTQWEAPSDWIDEAEEEETKESLGVDERDFEGDDDDNSPLPSNWEVMHDPTTGKPFYVDHERKITTWTRPKMENDHMNDPSAMLRPAVATPPTSGNASSTAVAAALRSSSSRARYTGTAPATSSNDPASSSSSYSNWGRSYQQEMAYYSQPPSSSSMGVDFSDAFPALEFSVQKVADALRTNCPSCGILFTMRVRRHHCRLCGDVFCDNCSLNRCTLPLEGPEFEKPVRVCDFCYQDVEAGNFFSLRRYFTPLHLYNGGDGHDLDVSGVATASNVNAALSAFTQDMEQTLQTGNTSNMDAKSIPPQVLVPEILKHLAQPETADRTVQCMAALLATKALAESTAEYALPMYKSKSALNHLLSVLERSGSDRKTLYVQEQAARTVFYLTERKTVLGVVEKAASSSSDMSQDSGEEKESEETSYSGGDVVLHLDLLRAVQSMLDHSSNRKNPNLSRWAAACIQTILAEDERRACLAVNDVAALVAVGEPASALRYESVLPQLIETGGMMILCSLLSVDDADTRAHAVAALGTSLTSTRTVNSSMATLAELTGGSAGRVDHGDGALVRSIVAGGGCADSVASLLLSADHGVARMGCQFLNSLVQPLLINLSTTATAGSWMVVSSGYQLDQDTTGSGACREAALDISTGSCLPALLSLVRASDGQRPTELRLIATETLAAIVYGIGDMGQAWSQGKYEQGLEENPVGVPDKFKTALSLMNQEGVVDACLDLVQSGSLGGGSGTGGGKDVQPPSSRIREAAAICLGSLTSCSAEAIMNLQTRPQVLSSLVAATNDISATIPSTLRGDTAPRCCGVLETVASIFLFAWQEQQQQHQAQTSGNLNSGASELLDATIEVLDAGVVPYLSRVLNAKIEWDSSFKAIGAMKGKAAACRLVCCLFGIALGADQTKIGMRRLMDAVDVDARNYRKGDKLPQNVMEAALSVLQTSSSKARNSLMGSAPFSSGQEYQAAVMDLVDAALLAAGSLCGSPSAPNVVEHTDALVADEPSLDSATGTAAALPPPPDMYVGRRSHLCSLATDVVIRGTRQGPALLPTMLVGGLGEATALSSVRLALAICQHGGKEQHAKLATSGILVPISDSLRTALSGGDLYKFSASLALVRFCGPHVAAGGGGLESVRNAIRVATNVLTLPMNPHATLDQMERQESLKAECIRALEALSRNASLWSSISSDALPSIVRFLQMSVGTSTAALDPRRQQTRCAALRSVLQIVQVPSHAVSAAENGLCDALGNLLLDKQQGNEEGNEVPMLALEVLHVIAMNSQARRKARLFDGTMVRSICAALGKSATLKPRKPTDSRADVTFLGLEILSSILLDITPAETPIEHVLQAPAAKAFLEAMAMEPQFVRALCSTLLLKTNMKVPRHDGDDDHDEGAAFDIPALYGDPLILVQESCGGYDDTHHAAAAVLYMACVFACAIESKASDAFWNHVWLENGAQASSDGLRLSAAFAAHFLALMTIDYKPLVPKEARRKQEYLTITRPLVRYRLLERLKDALEEVHENDDEDDDAFMVSLVVSFNVPHTCLSLWKDPALLDLAFDLIENIVKRQADDVLHLFVEGEAALQSLLDWLNLDTSAAATAVETTRSVSDIRRFLASTLGKLAESGLLTRAVEKFHVRSSAIQALAAACLAEEEQRTSAERPEDDEEEEVDTTSNHLSSVLMKCLVELCTATVRGKKKISLSAAEAESIAQNLGSKICQMVLSRFLERAKLQIYEMEDDDDEEEDSLMDAPDLAMLCAIAQHETALKIIRSLGGLHALSLVAAEGNVSAMGALKKACETDAPVLLEGDAHEVVLKIFSADNKSSLDSKRRQQLEGVAFELLARLCSDASAKGRTAVVKSEHCDSCVERARQILISLSGFADEGEEEDDDEDVDDTQGNTGVFADEEDDEEDEKESPPPPSAPSAPPPPPPSYNDMIARAVAPPALVEDDEEDELAPIGESERGVSACLLLSALAPMQSARQLLVENETFTKALSSLAGDTSIAELRFAGLKLVSALLPFVAGEDKDSTDRLSAVLLAALTSEHKLKATPTLNANLLHSTAIAGIVVVFDSLSTEQQEVAGTAIATHFQKTVKLCTTARSTAKQAQRLHAAELSYHLSMALLMVRGKEFMDRVFTQDVLVSFLHLIQWRMDPKTGTSTNTSTSKTVGKKSSSEALLSADQKQEQEDSAYWDASLSNCLLILSLLLWRPDGILKQAQIDLTALASTTLMVARPGKAPRKALELKSALMKLVATSNSRKDASAALSAQRILNRIF